MREKRFPSRWAGKLGFLLILGIGLYLVASAVTVVTGNLPEESCTYSDRIPEQAVQDEDFRHAPIGTIVWFPYGVKCSYFTGDDSPRIDVLPTWTNSALLYGGALLILTSVYLLGRPARNESKEI